MSCGELRKLSHACTHTRSSLTIHLQIIFSACVVSRPLPLCFSHRIPSCFVHIHRCFKCTFPNVNLVTRTTLLCMCACAPQLECEVMCVSGNDSRTGPLLNVRACFENTAKQARLINLVSICMFVLFIYSLFRL